VFYLRRDTSSPFRPRVEKKDSEGKKEDSDAKKENFAFSFLSFSDVKSDGSPSMSAKYHFIFFLVLKARFTS
jgi:hypothetical protein